MTGSLAVQPFDILHEYASGLHASECPVSLSRLHAFATNRQRIMRASRIARMGLADRLIWFVSFF